MSQPIDTHEYQLATSPRLFSIVAATLSYPGYGLVGFNDEAINLLEGGVALYLRSVAVFGMHKDYSIQSRRTFANPKPD